MAMAWITRITNMGSSAVTLLQNDPSWHPVVDGRQYGMDEPIVVAPGASHHCSYFVIPWRDYGRLEIRTARGALTYFVAPGDRGLDYLQGRASTGAQPAAIDLGRQGNQFYSPSHELRLELTDSGVSFVKLGIGWESVVGTALFDLLLGRR